DAANHTVTATIPRIPAGGSVTVTVTGEAGLFEANSRDFTASAVSAFADANQGNNRASQKVTVKNKRVAVSLVLQPVGDYPTSGVVTVSGSVECVTPFRHNTTFMHMVDYADLVNYASWSAKVVDSRVWAGSNCTVTVRSVTAPDGWEFKGATMSEQKLTKVMGDTRVEHDVAVQFVAVAPPLPLTGGVASDWLYLAGAGVLAAGVAAGLVARRRLQARV
ncbi:LPXTG cell wall anchor domain-containing protein, partial [Canibacter sp. lx-72]|uniref:LPXTG cell wall anchor domain-containing protein n=1 Tax=Canibacter zhuwentaonis TaxID=2837491 RepID=UPI001BDDBB7F